MIRQLGIDVGNNGAISLIVDGVLERVEDMPIVEIRRGKTTKRQVSAQALVGIIKEMNPTHAAVEKVSSMPNQGVSSTFAFGRAVGVISAVCELTRYNVHLVTPQRWKKHFHLTADKNESLDMARYLWPEAKLKLKKDINKAEALLIAEYLRHTINGIEKQKTA